MESHPATRNAPSPPHQQDPAQRSPPTHRKHARRQPSHQQPRTRHDRPPARQPHDPNLDPARRLSNRTPRPPDRAARREPKAGKNSRAAADHSPPAPGTPCRPRRGRRTTRRRRVCDGRGRRRHSDLLAHMRAAAGRARGRVLGPGATGVGAWRDRRRGSGGLVGVCSAPCSVAGVDGWAWIGRLLWSMAGVSGYSETAVQRAVMPDDGRDALSAYV
jgi:hypothetical protein